MRRIREGWVIPLVSLLTGSGAVLAQARPEQFGVQCCQVLQIPAAAFTPKSSSVKYEYLAPGYVYLTDLGTQAANQLWAPVMLPTGARIDELGVSYYDADGTHDLTVTLRGYTHGTPDTGGSPSFFDAGSVSSAGCCGTGYASSPTSHTVENDAAHDPAAAQLVVLVDLPAATSNLGFKGVDLRWARQVSAAPAAATFADVPASDGAFAFVEALAASGVTAGCGGGNYCPDAPLTRRQMAVFLSKALGLYWPD